MYGFYVREINLSYLTVISLKVVYLTYLIFPWMRINLR